MVKKLRRKFILIFMTITTATVVGIFLFIFFSAYQSEKRECEKVLSDYFSKGKDPRQENSSIVFRVKFSQSGRKIESTRNDESFLMSEEEADALAVQCWNSDKNTDYLWGYSLAYMKRKKPEGTTTIVFCDLSKSRKALQSLLLSFLFAGPISVLILYIISLFLSNWCTRPIEEAWKKQQQFVADASHELKTPLTVILANTELLKEQDYSLISEKEKNIRYIETEARHMSNLVNDMIFLAKSDALQEPLPEKKVNFSEICMNSYLSFEAVAYEKKITMSCDIEPDKMVTGFSDKLEQLCGILLDNACKYTDNTGKIHVALHGRKNELMLEIKNSGAAIPKEAIPHLFERFYRVDEARTRGKSGYGLGLSIAHQIVSLHGGKIYISSSEEQGVTALVELPCCQKVK